MNIRPGPAERRVYRYHGPRDVPLERIYTVAEEEWLPVLVLSVGRCRSTVQRENGELEVVHHSELRQEAALAGAQGGGEE